MPTAQVWVVCFDSCPESKTIGIVADHDLERTLTAMLSDHWSKELQEAQKLLEDFKASEEYLQDSNDVINVMLPRDIALATMRLSKVHKYVEDLILYQHYRLDIMTVLKMHKMAMYV